MPGWGCGSGRALPASMGSWNSSPTLERKGTKNNPKAPFKFSMKQ